MDNRTHNKTGCFSVYVDEDDSKNVALPYATPYEWTAAHMMPRRQWLYGAHLVRGMVSVTVAPGGVGKSSLMIIEALAMVTGKDLLGVSVIGGPKRVWLWNLEDPSEETTRKVAAACKHYRISESDIGERLFCDSGRQQPMVIAKDDRDGDLIQAQYLDGLISELIANEVDVIIVDPFVSCHQVNENDNSAIDAVVKAWGRVAEEANCAVALVHHTRKLGKETGTAESSRGAKALIDGARDVRVLNAMSPDEAKRWGIDNPRQFFKVLSDKHNLAKHSPALWFQLVSVSLDNSSSSSSYDADEVGVVATWEPPNAYSSLPDNAVNRLVLGLGDGQYRASIQCGQDWVGNKIAEIFDLDVNDSKDKATIKEWIKIWLNSDVLEDVMVKDKKSAYRPHIQVTAEFKKHFTPLQKGW